MRLLRPSKSERAEEAKRKMSRERFVELMEDAVIALPSNLKSLLRLVEDPEIDEASRTTIAGGLIHVVSNGAAIPGVRGTLQHVGSAIALRLALESTKSSSAEALERHAEDEPELYDFEEILSVARDYLGEGMKIIEDVVGGFDKLEHEGYSASECVRDTDSGTWLYDVVHEALVETVEIFDDDVQREIKEVDRIRQHLERRLRHR